ncbi:MAG: DUF4139 domain-containing protein [Deltaproteobacteria bacterium]|nr:DUF4139 domain-containing protein [Deltaproteobacteria bacterium]
MNQKSTIGTFGLLLLFSLACTAAKGPRYPTTVSALALDRVVLYRNGVGYFERTGEIEGNVLTLRVRKDQVNDLLKSLTVVDRSTGKALSVSMPLDPQSWQNAALSLLAPGRGSLAQMLDALKGVRISVDSTEGSFQGRIVMVERMQPEPKPEAKSDYIDYKLTLLDAQEVNLVRLSSVSRIAIEEGDLVMQLHRRLDASAGEGMFQQLGIDIRLAGNESHDLTVSYVVSAPLWKPTYRVVLSDDGSQQALLQGWAVVDNTSGESWDSVLLSLTSGAPIAFLYDLHTPQEIERPDLTQTGVSKRVRVAVGETGYGEEEAPAEPESQMEADEMDAEMAAGDTATAEMLEMRKTEVRRDEAALSSRSLAKAKKAQPAPSAEVAPMRIAPSLDIGSLQASTSAQAKAERVSGLTRFDLQERVTVPDGSATMVALINQRVKGEELFLFKPGGSGSGFEFNPYRVVRFTNSTEFALEPGPISIYSRGSFVGEGISELVASNATATIPFAVEPRIIVRSREEYSDEEMRLIKIVRGVLEVETFMRYSTLWSVKGMSTDTGYKVLVRHPRRGEAYKLVKPKSDVEQLPDAYLVPIKVAAKKSEGEVEVVEQTPARSSITIWDNRAIDLLTTLLHLPKLDAASRAKLEPIVTLRQQIGRIDTEVEGLKRQQRELDERAEQTRENLQAIKKDPLAAELRARLSRRLEQFTSDADKLGRRIVELESKRLELKVDLEDRLRDLMITAE